jgi:hypothetical protein
MPSGDAVAIGEYQRQRTAATPCLAVSPGGAGSFTGMHWQMSASHGAARLSVLSPDKKQRHDSEIAN